MNILLCTAEELMLTTFEFRFRKNGWKLMVAVNAPTAIEKTQKFLPDAIVVDLDLPGFEGLDIIQSIRRSGNEEPPILTYTSVDNEKLLLESLRLGANDFIISPIKPDELTIRIRQQLLKKKLEGTTP